MICEKKRGVTDHLKAVSIWSQTIAVADRRSHKVPRSSSIIWKHTSAIVCDLVIVITDDRRRSQKIEPDDRKRSQKIEPCSIFCDRLRSIAIVRSYGNQRSAIKTYPIIFWISTHDSTLLSNKAWVFACNNRLFVVDKVTLVTRNLWRTLRDMSASTREQ